MEILKSSLELGYCDRIIIQSSRRKHNTDFSIMHSRALKNIERYHKYVFDEEMKRYVKIYYGDMGIIDLLSEGYNTLICGSDFFNLAESKKGGLKQILDQAERIIIAERQGSPIDIEYACTQYEDIKIIGNLAPTRARDIRYKIRNSMPITGLVPGQIEKFIIESYREDCDK